MPRKTKRTILEKLFLEAVDHLVYCGYGDAWERSIAEDSKLQERLGKEYDRIRATTEEEGEELNV